MCVHFNVSYHISFLNQQYASNTYKSAHPVPSPTRLYDSPPALVCACQFIGLQSQTRTGGMQLLLSLNFLTVFANARLASCAYTFPRQAWLQLHKTCTTCERAPKVAFSPRLPGMINWGPLLKLQTYYGAYKVARVTKHLSKIANKTILV